MLAPWHLSIPRCHPSMAFSFLSALRVLSPSASRIRPPFGPESPRFFIAPNRALSTANGGPFVASRVRKSVFRRRSEIVKIVPRII